MSGGLLPLRTTPSSNMGQQAETEATGAEKHHIHHSNGTITHGKSTLAADQRPVAEYPTAVYQEKLQQVHQTVP